MPRETNSARSARLLRVIAGLRRAYPDAHCELNYSSPLELLVATILSAQCTDKQVNIVTADLFRKYRTARDYAEADPTTLEKEIQRIGLFRNKAKSIRACCRSLVDIHAGEVPRTMEALTALAGIGRKTANVILGNAFGISEGIVVDTHVARLSARLGLTRETDAVKIESDLQKLVPRESWTLFSHWLIWHGMRDTAIVSLSGQGGLIRLARSAGTKARMSETWFFMESGHWPAALNMAMDEALLEQAGCFEGPVLRFYRWIEMAATFGYSQRHADASAWTALRPLVRRPTGGGLVSHDSDWTYSAVFPAGHAWHQLSAAESYERWHRWVSDALSAVSVPARLATDCHKELPGRCFAGAERYDVLSGDTKIAGAAQRRTRHGLLIQGSLQPPPCHVARPEWERAMLAIAEKGWGVQWMAARFDASLESRAFELADSVYSQPGFNMRR
jgi:endonuclease-3